MPNGKRPSMDESVVYSISANKKVNRAIVENFSALKRALPRPPIAVPSQHLAIALRLIG